MKKKEAFHNIFWMTTIVLLSELSLNLGQTNQSISYLSDLNVQIINDCTCVCLTNQTTVYKSTTPIVTRKKPIIVQTTTTQLVDLNEVLCLSFYLLNSLFLSLFRLFIMNLFFFFLIKAKLQVSVQVQQQMERQMHHG